MVTSIYADTTPLLEAIATSEIEQVVQETLNLLGMFNVLPDKVAGSVGIPALWGGAEPHQFAAFAAVRHVAEWMRAIPIGPDPSEDTRRKLSTAIPLVQGFLAVAGAVRKGLPEPHPALPEPLLPAEVKDPHGAMGGLREAFAQRDVETVRRILLGYHATGTDYRTVLTAIYAALVHRYPESGHPLVFANAASSVLDMAEWGNHMPPLIYWYPPIMVDASPDTPAAQSAQQFAADQSHELGWLRTRLAVPKEEAAGAQFQQALFAGDAAAACEATLAALRNGATTRGVAAGMALAAAQRLNAVPEGDRAELVRVGHVLQYVHAVHVAQTQVQDSIVFPLVYTAATAVNALGPARGPSAPSTPASAALAGGGLIPGAMLRTLEQQLDGGETTSALTMARRYMQMGHSARALAGIAASVAATYDTTAGDDYALHAMPLVTTAGDEYLSLPPALAQNGQNALLNAMIRLASELRGQHTLADRVSAAIDARAR
ncbi:MAG TPA: hypothetical protein VGP82_11765 [Ktedonobacterales bacterium]|nr:hypothetical protein [Ktedonobacterales bacterium]